MEVPQTRPRTPAALFWKRGVSSPFSSEQNSGGLCGNHWSRTKYL